MAEIGGEDNLPSAGGEDGIGKASQRHALDHVDGQAMLDKNSGVAGELDELIVGQFDRGIVRMGQENARHAAFQRHRRKSHDLGRRDWNYFKDPEAVSRARIEALSTFLGDFKDGRAQGRYLPAMLPCLPFSDCAFDLALCSFLFFLRPERHSIRFHVDGLSELVRVAREVRVFPILQLDGHVPDYAEHVYESLRLKKIEVSFVCVPPTLHKGADRLLVLQR